MAKATNEAEAAAAPVQAVPKRKNLLVLGIVGGVMLIEGVSLYFAMKMFGAGAKEGVSETVLAGLADKSAPHSSELVIAEFKALNEKSGATYMVDIKVCARVPSDRQGEAEGLVQSRKETILDRLNQLVRSADAQHLKEEDLATLRRLMAAELNAVLGKTDLIEEVLITRFSKFRADI